MAAARTNQNNGCELWCIRTCSVAHAMNVLIFSLLSNNAIAIWLAHSSSCGLVFRLLLPLRHGQTEEQPRGRWQRREGWWEEDERSTHYRRVWKASSKAFRSCEAVSGVVVPSQNDRNIHVVASAGLAKLDSLWVLTCSQIESGSTHAGSAQVWCPCQARHHWNLLWQCSWHEGDLFVSFVNVCSILLVSFKVFAEIKPAVPCRSPGRNFCSGLTCIFQPRAVCLP